MKLKDKINKFLYVRRMREGIVASTKKVKGDRSLSAEQKQQIEHFYQEQLGISVTNKWHEYFYKRTGQFSPKYIPSDLYYTQLIGKLNFFPFNEAYTDKCLTESILPNVPQPKTILKNVRGYYYVNGKAVSKKDAIALCQNLSDVIIKPALAAHGEGVKKFSCHDGITTIDGLTIEQVFDKYKSHFLIQEAIHQHEKMAELNPSSVNTIRILTYRSGMEVLVLYTVVRIGRMGFDVDNETAGGISAKINTDGTICKYAYGKPGVDQVETTDNGTVLDGFVIPSFDKAIQIVKDAHLQLPYFDLVGWDIAIQESGEPVMIEWNTWPELSQTANGPAFGEYTERVLSEIKERRNTRNRNW